MRDNERERLYYLFQESKCPVDFIDNKHMLDTVDYLLANGVIVPPCKVGDTVYSDVLGEIEAFVVISVELAYTPKGFEGEFVSSNGKYPMLFSFENIGKTVFLTREEAEKALRGGV